LVLFTNVCRIVENILYANTEQNNHKRTFDIRLELANSQAVRSLTDVQTARVQTQRRETFFFSFFSPPFFPFHHCSNSSSKIRSLFQTICPWIASEVQFWKSITVSKANFKMAALTAILDESGSWISSMHNYRPNQVHCTWFHVFIYCRSGGVASTNNSTWPPGGHFEWVSEWVIGVLRRFQQSFSYITTVAACCMRRDMRSGFKCCQHWCTVQQTQDTNTPPSHIILTPGQPVLVLSS